MPIFWIIFIFFVFFLDDLSTQRQKEMDDIYLYGPKYDELNGSKPESTSWWSRLFFS